MEKLLKYYAHLYGFGLTVLFDNKEWNVYRFNIDTIVLYRKETPTRYNECRYDQCKPFLRSLDSMTEEEHSLLWGHLDYNMDHSKKKRTWYFENLFKGHQFSDKEDQFSFEDSVKACNWLRKNNFDCDGLLEATLAIKQQII